MLSSQVVFEEIIMLGLRSRGIILSEFHRIGGVDIQTAAPVILGKMCDGGYAIIDNHCLRLTSQGYPFADYFALQIVLEAEALLPDLAKDTSPYQTAKSQRLVEIDL